MARRIVTVLGVFTTVFAAGTSAPALVHATEEPVDCAVVAALVEARMPSAALEELGEDESCAGIDVSDLEESIGRAAGLAARAKAALENKDEANARLLALASLAIDVGNATAREVMSSLEPAGEKPDPFEVADALLSKGFEVEAKAVVIEALKNGASADRVPRELVDERIPVVDWYGDLPAAFQMLLAAALVGVVAVANRLRSRTRVRLAFNDGFGDDAATLTALTRVRLRQLGETHQLSLQIGGAPEGEVTMPQFGDVDARLKVVDNLFKAVLTPRPMSLVLGIGGGVDAPSVRRATAELHRGKTCSSTTWRVVDHLDNALELEMASAFAAGWALLTTQPTASLTEADQQRSGLPTRDARSYGALLAGNTAFGASDFATARRYYSDALGDDRTNYVAEANLALAVGTSSSTADILVAIDTLSALLGTSERPGSLPAGSVERERAHFNRATLTANLLASLRSTPPPTLDLPLPRRQELVDQAFASLGDVLSTARVAGPGGSGSAKPAMSSFANLVAQPAAVLAAGLTLEVGLHTDGLQRPGNVGKVLDLAQVVISSGTVLLGPPTGDHAPDNVAADIIKRVSSTPSPSAKTHYNLACSLTRQREFDRAVRHLRRAVVIVPGIWTQATLDPVLAPLRGRAEWVELARSFGTAKPKAKDPK